MKSSLIWFLLVAVVLSVAALCSLGVGAVPIGPSRIAEILSGRCESIVHPAETTIVWQLRLPRILLACFVGAGLGAAGAGYQGLFRNPLADPFVIGASSGAALGATAAIVAGFQGSVFGLAVVPAASLLGSLISVATVYGIASTGSRMPVLSLLLTGVALSSLLGALVSLLMFLHDEQLMTIFGWLMGSLSGRGWSALGSAAPLIVVGGVVLWLQSRSLDALSFGDETATSLGLSLTKLRGLAVLSAGLATAAAVSTGGVIGFIGLIAPHMARSLIGARHSLVIPMSGLLGALLLLIADDLARIIVSPAELPVGIVTALLGSPFFLFVLKSRKRALGAEA